MHTWNAFYIRDAHYRNEPPVTSIACPEMYDECLHASISMAPAASSGVPARRSGQPARVAISSGSSTPGMPNATCSPPTVIAAPASLAPTSLHMSAPVDQ